MIGNFDNGVLPVVITWFVKVEIFGTFFSIALFVFNGGFGKLNTFTLTL